jgi:hypothetical protein
MNDTITPDDAERHGVILSNPYPVLDVARIAAGCSGRNHRERVIRALRLLGAAEELTDPWSFQYAPTKEDFAALELERMAADIIAKATKDGRVLRRALCEEACLAAGLEVSNDTSDKRFKEWLADAAESQARWTVARELLDQEHPIDQLDAAVDSRRKKASGKQRAAEAKSFQQGFEIRSQQIVMRDEVAARRLLLGVSPDYPGFISFLRNLPEAPKPKPPRRRGDNGVFEAIKRDEKGRILSNRAEKSVKSQKSS